eukprot:snap_masked-scaffold_18-processed-gene-5.21-mRNA-1 protein AED:0.10 eAED:1.00 QI:0/-1/0/1/-1/1/1/0/386
MDSFEEKLSCLSLTPNILKSSSSQTSCSVIRLKTFLEEQKKRKYSKQLEIRLSQLNSIQQKNKWQFSNLTEKDILTSKIFSYPEYLVDIPEGFCNNFLFQLRPEGQRCLLMTKCGRTFLRKKNGKSYLSNMQTPFPGGNELNQKHSGLSEYEVILDVICQEKLVLVMDLLCWKGQLFLDSDAVFRQFWLSSKFSEICFPRNSEYEYKLIERQNLDKNNFAQVYASPHKFKTDGFLFIHRESRYISGVNPLVFLWKDIECSNFFIQKSEKIYFSAELTLSDQLNKFILRTLDGVEFSINAADLILNSISGNSVGTHLRNKNKIIVNCVAEKLGSAEKLQSLKVIGINKNKSSGDLFSKILLQHYKIYEKEKIVTFRDIMEVLNQKQC